MLELSKRSDDLSTQLAAIPRETIATVDGTPITIPVEVPAAVGVGYARTRLNRGEEIAITWALDLLLGEEGMSLLLSSNVDDAGLDTIMDVVIGRIRGATTGTADVAPKASPNGSPTTRKRAASPARSRAARK